MPPSCSNRHLLRIPPRQCLDAIHDILESLLVLLCGITIGLPLKLLAVIPLHLKRRKNNPRIKTIDIVIRIGGESFKLADEGEQFVDVIATNSETQHSIPKDMNRYRQTGT